MKNKIVCKHCGNILLKRAKSCPNCGTKYKKPIWKRIWFWILVIFILIFTGIINSNTESVQQTPEAAATAIVVDWLDDHDFNQNSVNIIQSTLGEDFVEITDLKDEGTHGCAIYCDNELSYYLIFYSYEHPEHPGELMSIDTTEDDYKDRERLYQSY